MVLIPLTVQGATGPQGPQGEAGADGADGADGATGPQGPAGPNLIPTWAPGSDYEVGALALDPDTGQVCRLHSAESNNGYANAVELVGSATVDVTAGTHAPGSTLTGAATTDDVWLLCAAAVCGASWSVSVSGGLSSLRTQAGEFGAYGQSGVGIYYARHGVGVAPSVTVGASGSARLTWLLLRNVAAGTPSRVGGTTTTSYPNWYDAIIYAAEGGNASTATALVSVALVQGSSGTWRVGQFATPLAGVKHLGEWGTWTHALGGTFASGVSIRPVSTGTALTESWEVGGTTTQAAHAVALVALPSAGVGAPFFDRSKWRPVSVDDLGTPLDVVADIGLGLVNTYDLMLTEEDRHYTLTAPAWWDAPPASPVSAYRIVLPVPRVPQVPHRVRLTVTQPTSRTAPRYAPQSVSAAATVPERPNAARYFHDGIAVEPSRYPGRTSSVSWEWVPERDGWVNGRHDGPVVVRDHHVGDEDGDKFTAADLPLYFSPELKAKSYAATSIAAHRRALTAVSTDTKRLLGQYDVWADICDDLDESLGQRTVMNASVNAGVLGWFVLGGYNALVTSSHDPAQIDGRTMLHELGHAVDQCFMPGGYWQDANGVDPAPDGYHPALTTGPGYLSREKGIVDAFDIVYNPSGAYYIQTPHEFLAQVFMFIWAARLPDRNATDVSAWDSWFTSSGFTNSAYSAAKTHLKSLYVIPNDW